MAYSGSNFSVYIRNRGPVDLNCWTATSKEITRHSQVSGKLSKIYQFDRVFGHQCSQEDIFETCAEPLLDHFLHGYNSTIFAYGQTGTGKTHTMAGDCAIHNLPGSLEATRQSLNTSFSVNISDSMRTCNTSMQSPELSIDAGLQPRILQAVLERLKDNSGYGVQDWLLEISCFEVYNEEINDLLNPRTLDRSRKPLMIATNRSTQTVEVIGTSSRSIRNLKSALAVLQEAISRRKTDSTNLNSHSSRSHMITSLTLLIKHADTGMAVRSKLNLVDLAGSECVGRSGAVDNQAKEAGLINKSLLALGNIISNLVAYEGKQQNALANGRQMKKPHISYRDSKLTHLLQDSLGGHTKTVMIATVNLANSNHNENVNTLEYALRAQSIRNKTQTELELTSMPNTLEAYGQKLEQIQSELAAQRRKDGVVQLSEPTYNDLKMAKTRYTQKLTSIQTELKCSVDEIQQLKQQIQQLEKSNQDQSIELKEYRRLECHRLAQHESSESIRIQAGQIQQNITDYISQVDTLSSQLINSFGELPAEIDRIKVFFAEHIKSGIFSGLFEDMEPELHKIADKTVQIQFSNLGTNLEGFMQQIDQMIRQSVDVKMLSMKSALSSVISDLVQMRVSTSQLLETCTKMDDHIKRQAETLQIQKQIIQKLMEHETKARERARVEAENIRAEADKRFDIVNELVNNQDRNDIIPELFQDTSRALNTINSVNCIAERFNEKAGPLHAGLKSTIYPSDGLNEAISQLQNIMQSHLDEFKTQLSSSSTDIIKYYQEIKAEPTDMALTEISTRITKLKSQILETWEENCSEVAKLDKSRLLSELGILAQSCELSKEKSINLKNLDNYDETTESAGSALDFVNRSPQHSIAAHLNHDSSSSPSQYIVNATKTASNTLFKPTKASLMKSTQSSPHRSKNAYLNQVPKLTPLKNHQPQSPNKLSSQLKLTSSLMGSPLRKSQGRLNPTKTATFTKSLRPLQTSSVAKRFKPNDR